MRGPFLLGYAVSNTIGGIQIDIEARLAKFETDIGRSARLLEREMARSTAAVERQLRSMQAQAERSQKAVTGELEKIQKSAERTGKLIAGYFAVGALVSYTQQLAHTADAYSNIQAKVRLAAGEHTNLGDAVQKVFDASQRTYNSFEATAALVNRTAGALRSAGQDAATAFNTAVQLAEVFNKSLVVSGASATEAASSAQQFSQALASGKFQGDEFRSVMENNSRFASLLADSLGVTTAKLREMSTAGQLNIQSMLGVLKHTQALDAQFAQMPLTIGRATTQLSNAWTKFIGESDQASGASRRVAGTLQLIANNLPQITSALITLGEVAVSVFAAKVAGSAIAAGRAIMTATGQAIAAEHIWRSTQAAAISASVGMSAVAAAGRGLLAAVGGIPGILVAATAGFVYLATRATDVSTEVARLTAESEKLESQALSLHGALKLLATGAEAPKKSLLELKEAQLQELEAARARMTFTNGFVDGLQANGFAAMSLRSEMAKLREAEAAFNVAHIEAELSDLVRVFGGAINAAINWRQSLKGVIGADPNLAKEAEDMEKQAAKIGNTKVQYYELVKAKELDTAATKVNAQAGSEAYRILAEATDKKYAAVLAAAAKEDKATASLKAHREETRGLVKDQRDSEKAAEQYQLALEKLADLGDKSTKSLGALSSAEAVHVTRLRDIAQAGGKAWEESNKLREAQIHEATLHHSTAQAVRAETEAKAREALIRGQVADKVDKENRAYQQQIVDLRKQLDISGPILKQLRDRASSAWLSDRDSAAADAVQRLRSEYEQLDAELQQKLLPSMGELEASVAAQAVATYDAEKAAQFWRRTWEGAVDNVANAIGDFAVGNIKTWKDFTKSLVSTFKQAVAQIIAEWAKTKLLGWFSGTSSAGGGWGGLLAGAAALLGGSSAASGSSGSSATSGSGTGNFSYSGGSSSGISVDSLSSMYKGYQMLFGGGTGYAGSAAYANAAMYGPPADMAPGFMGPSTAMSTPGPYGSMGSYGTAAAWGGGIMGAYYGFQRGGDGSALGKVGSTVGYGALGMGIAGTAAGMAGGLSTGAAAGGAFSALGSAAWIPIVGWIAAIVAVIDKFSGGKVFGTKYRPESATTTIGLGEDGANVSASLTEWKYRRNIFQWNSGGSLQAMRRFGEKDNRTTEIPVTPEMQRAADQFWKSIQQVMVKAAKVTGDETAGMIDASMIVRQEFDKKGKLKATHYIAEIFGKQYEEATAELAQMRIQAEAAIKQLGISKIGSGASAIAEQYRSSAEALMDVAATMLQVTADIRKGATLLAGGDTLESVMAYVEHIQEAGESISDTYKRLAEASAQYESIMKGVSDSLDTLRLGDTPSRRMEQALKQWEEQTTNTIEQLNAAAEAAGLLAAREEDLAKVRTLSEEQLKKMSSDFFAGLDAAMVGIDGHATPATDFAVAMRGIDKTMHDNILTANMLARAAGLSGASEAQLAKVHELAARQAAAAIRSLEGVGRQQVKALYGGNWSLDEINADIAAMEAQASEASSSLTGFGNSIADVAAQASEAMRLLLGDLSPLNDQQKLQQALTGLYAGIVEKDEVLQIGRRLYASSAAYTALFNQVMAVPSSPANSVATGDGTIGGVSTHTVTGMSLAELYALRDAETQEKRLADARSLAETIASLAAAQDKTFEEVARDLGLNLGDLGKDLGFSADALLKYLEKIDVNANVLPDSITSNFDRLLAKLDQIWGTGPTFVPLPTTVDDVSVRDPRVHPVTPVHQGASGTDTLTRVTAEGNDRVVEAIDRGFGVLNRNYEFNTPRSTRLEPIR